MNLTQDELIKTIQNLAQQVSRLSIDKATAKQIKVSILLMRVINFILFFFVFMRKMKPFSILFV